MKFQISNSEFRIARAAAGCGPGLPIPNSPFAIRHSSGFTMIEIAICLAIISFALVAIIGVLPLGMSTQRDVREETIISQDATVLLEAIRGAARGADNLTNYVYAITVTNLDAPNKQLGYYNPVLAAQMNFNAAAQAASFPTVPAGNWFPVLTNGANIVGLLGTPEYTYTTNHQPVIDTFNAGNYTTNYVHACVRSLSGLASEMPPQDNDIIIGDTFGYRLYCVNALASANTNAPLQGFARQLAGNLRELRLTFSWPLLPSGKVVNRGNSPKTFRATLAGQLGYQPANGWDLYFYQTQSFTNAP